MRIDSDRRYFKLNEKGKAIFEEYSEARVKALAFKFKTAYEMLVELGVPEEVELTLGIYEPSGNIAFPAKVYEYASDMFIKPHKGYTRLRQDNQTSKLLQGNLDAIEIPNIRKWFPTLSLHRLWIMGHYSLHPSLGVYGDEVVLLGIPRDPDPGDEYEPDLELLEEMTLAEWAALVEKVEGQEGAA